MYSGYPSLLHIQEPAMTFGTLLAYLPEGVLGSIYRSNHREDLRPKLCAGAHCRSCSH